MRFTTRLRRLIELMTGPAGPGTIPRLQGYPVATVRHRRVPH